MATTEHEERYKKIRDALLQGDQETAARETEALRRYHEQVNETTTRIIREEEAKQQERMRRPAAARAR